VVADYHHAQLGELVARVGEVVDRYRAGELDAFDVDQVLFQHSRAAKELWKTCNSPEEPLRVGDLRHGVLDVIRPAATGLRDCCRMGDPMVFAEG
jgi:hypothetical protein